FVPIVFVQEEAGQLFRDIAIAISSAVVLSLVVSITVIPTLSSRILGEVQRTEAPRVRRWSIYQLASSLTNGIASFVYWMCGRVSARLGVAMVIESFCSASFCRRLDTIWKSSMRLRGP
ncbi:MAG: efflux RND transporter permease subunit, partial [Deltaproteobacteria bacterium]|nr:efflux RND transporter permease subunit [Deltaproteobacteria bacterium]